MTTVAIPNRPVFRAQEVCEIAEVQPYVLRSWEAEFPELGVSKSPSSPRVYRKKDVELVLRIKHMLFTDGLTLAGARKQLTGEGVESSDEIVTDADVAAMIDDTTRQHLRDVKRGLQWIMGVLSGKGITPEDRVLHAAPARAVSSARTASTARKAPASKKKRK